MSPAANTLWHRPPGFDHLVDSSLSQPTRADRLIAMTDHVTLAVPSKRKVAGKEAEAEKARAEAKVQETRQKGARKS